MDASNVSTHISVVKRFDQFTINNGNYEGSGRLCSKC